MTENVKGKIVNRVELSEILGKSLPTISAWIKQQMPYVQKGHQGKDWQFDTAAVIAWHTAKETGAAERKNASKEQLEIELMRADLKNRQLKYDKAAGEVASLPEVERALATVFAEVRAGLRNIPRRVAPSLVGEMDEKRIKATLLDEIDDSLRALSQFDVNSLSGDDD